MILLDTNVLIHYIKGLPGVVERLQSVRRDQLAISTITVYELEYGTLKARFSSARRKALAGGLEAIRRIPFDQQAALAAARIRVELEAAGAVIGPLDLLIAGVAVTRGAELATANTGEFRRVKGLVVQNWG
jgi:tRNA(fMet)-specific endonuclease VapC